MSLFVQFCLEFLILKFNILLVLIIIIIDFYLVTKCLLRNLILVLYWIEKVG